MTHDSAEENNINIYTHQQQHLGAGNEIVEAEGLSSTDHNYATLALLCPQHSVIHPIQQETRHAALFLSASLCCAAEASKGIVPFIWE